MTPTVRIVICEQDRVAELHKELGSAGVTEKFSVILFGGFAPGANIEWVGLAPSPDGSTFDLRAEGSEGSPRWVEYFHRLGRVGWNYTRDLIAFRVPVSRDGGVQP